MCSAVYGLNESSKTKTSTPPVIPSCCIASAVSGALKTLINYDFDYLYTNLNIQWIGIDQLKNIEGRVDFLLKDFKSNAELPNSAF